MIGFIRKIAWKILGSKHYDYLKYKNQQNLKDASWVEMGDNSYDNGAVVWRWSKQSKLQIGKYCSIASGVNFICDSGYHTESEVTTFPLFHEILSKDDEVVIGAIKYRVSAIKEELVPSKCNIVVGNDVWIGYGATILPGTVVGNGVSILAGAVVSGHIADYSVVGGIPAKVVSMKHKQDVIDKLNQISWWNWSEKSIKERVNDFYLPVEQFVEKYNL